MFKSLHKPVIAILITVSSLFAAEAAVTLPNAFEANTPAKAAEVNANFNAVADGVNSNAGRIGTVEGQLTNKQNRVVGSCTVGASIRAINSDGTVTCETDNDTNTLYSAGSGLTQSGTTFSVNTAATQARVNGYCAAGYSIRAISSTGAVTCQVDGNTDFSGIEYATTASIEVPKDGTIIYPLAVTITAPKAGYIKLEASFEYSLAHIVDLNDFSSSFGIVSDNTLTTISPITATSASSSYRTFLIENSLPTGSYKKSIHSSRVIYVSSGGTRTYYLAARRNITSSTSSYIYYPTLMATFIPNRY